MKERLFIAATLSEAQIEELLKLQAQLKAQAERLSLTRPENLHLTLRFIGDCNAKQRQAVLNVMELVKASHKDPLQCRITGSGIFARAEGTLVYARLEVSPGVEALVEALQSALAAAGFHAEKKAWLPHVTLARRVHLQKEPFKLTHSALTMEAVPSIQLMRSAFTDQGMKYSALFKWAPFNE